MYLVSKREETLVLMYKMKTVNEISRGEELSHNAIQKLSKYNLSRAKLVSKLLKYPGIEDYRKSIIELDKRFCEDLFTTCRDLRNSYAVIFDMIVKNRGVIENPRTSNRTTLY